MAIQINKVPEDARSKIIAKIKELTDILYEHNVSILLNADTMCARLLPAGFMIETDERLTNDEDTQTFISDDFEYIELPIDLYDPNYNTIVKIDD